MNTKFSEQQKNIMRTAFLTAYPKIFTDIDYSMEIFSHVKDLAIKYGFSFQPNQFSNMMALEIEARHKAVNHQLNQIIDKDTLVIEIAAGLSPRCLQYQNFDYVELDLKPVIDIKKNIYNLMGHKFSENTLFSVDLSNVTKLHQCLETILKNNKHKKIVVVNEGLFWYLTKEIITSISQAFVKMFQDYDWCWITADCPCDGLQDFEHRKIISDSAKIKRDLFADYNDFKNLFANCSLTCKRYQLTQLLKYENLFSAKFLSISKQETINRINSYTSVAVLKNIK